MKTLIAAALCAGCASTVSAQPSLAEQALQQLEEHRAGSHTIQPAPQRRDPAIEQLPTFALAALEESRAGASVMTVRPREEAVPRSHGLGLGGLLAIVPVGIVLAIGLVLSRRRTLNYGLRYSRALIVGTFCAGVWTWAVLLGGIANLNLSGLIVQLGVVPAIILWIAPLLVAAKERLQEHPVFRRWFLFERGGSARWAGPRHYRTRLFAAFSRRRDPNEGYVNV